MHRPARGRAQVEDAQLGLDAVAARDAREHVHLAHELRRPARRRAAVHLVRRPDLHDLARRASRPAGRPARAPPPGRGSRAGRWRRPRAGSARPRGAGRRAASRRGSRTARRAAPARARARARAPAPPAGARRRRARAGSGRLVLEADELERAPRRARRAPRAAAPSSPKATLPSHRQVREQRVVLEDHPDPALLGRHHGPARPRPRRSTTTSPASGRSKPAIRRSSVVLPQPDGPSTATQLAALDLEVSSRTAGHRAERLRQAAQPHVAHAGTASGSSTHARGRRGLDLARTRARTAGSARRPAAARRARSGGRAARRSRRATRSWPARPRSRACRRPAGAAAAWPAAPSSPR